MAEDLSVKELEQLYDKCDAEGISSDEEILQLIAELNKDDDEESEE